MDPQLFHIYQPKIRERDYESSPLSKKRRKPLNLSESVSDDELITRDFPIG